MQTSDYIAIISIVVTVLISMIGSIYKIITNTNRFEIAEHYTKELIDWYSKIILIIKSLKISEKGKEKDNLLAELSALIDVGRFYYPNVINDNYGEEKPEAFIGYRHMALEYLVWIYDLFNGNDYSEVDYYIEFCERNFTSIIFNRINPRERNERYSKYKPLKLPEKMTIKEFYENWRYDPKTQQFYKVNQCRDDHSFENTYGADDFMYS